MVGGSRPYLSQGSLGGQMVSAGLHNGKRLSGDHGTVWMTNQRHSDVMDKGVAVGQGSDQVAGISLSLTLAKVVDTTVVESISNSVQVGVVGDHSAVGVGHQAGVSISLGLTLAEVVDTTVAVESH